MKTVDRERIFRRGFLPSDFGELATNLLLVSPQKRPERTSGGILTTTDARFEALYFKVEAHGPFGTVDLGDGYVSTNHLSVGVGDLVCIRNAFAEPIVEDRALSIVDCMHVWAVLQRAADAEAQVARETEAESAAKLEIQAERARLRKGL